MDQYLINLDLEMLYFDALELIELIKESGNERLIEYIQSLEQQVKDQT